MIKDIRQDFEYDGDADGSMDEPQTFFKEFTSKLYEHYMDYALDDFTKARQLCTLLRNATERDTVMIRINSPGGRLDIAAMVVNAIEECQGDVVGVIECECASAATLVFLACSKWQVHRWGSMMIHHASYGAYGKSHEVASRVGFTKQKTEAITRQVYEYFLTDSEIEDVLKGQDLYLTQSEIVSRLEILAEARNSQQEDTGDESEEHY